MPESGRRGAALPLAAATFSPQAAITPAVSIASILFLVLLGAVGARAGGAPVLKSVLRVTFWGAAAMALTAGVGLMFGVAA
jgi:VIT1/CCC1 family predicted Fe2+/Mn2+ transporter